MAGAVLIGVIFVLMLISELRGEQPKRSYKNPDHLKIKERGWELKSGSNPDIQHAAYAKDKYILYRTETEWIFNREDQRGSKPLFSTPLSISDDELNYFDAVVKRNNKPMEG